MSQQPTERERIVEAADRLFYGRGIQSVGMDAVREEAGVPLKRLYAEFASKDALLSEVLTHRSQLWNDGIADAARDASTPRAKLLAIYDFLGDWFRSDGFRGCGFVNAFGELGAVSADVAAVAQEQKASFQRYVAELVAEMGGSPVLASQLAILAEGAQTTAAIGRRPEAAEHAREAAEVLIGAEFPVES